MSDNTSLGDRMKQYEQAVGPVLMGRTPAIIRVDGKAFHTFTRQITEEIDPSVKYHFSEKFHRVMMLTASALVVQIQNAQLAYTQSDEISILLCDWQSLESQQWFGGDTNKIVSVAASMATAYFNYFWDDVFGTQADHYTKMALFDARAYNVPREDVDNYFLWRQRDALRNSVNFIARKFISHKQLQGLNGLQIKGKLFAECGVVWDEYPLWEQRGACVYRRTDQTFRSDLFPAIQDENIPLFSEHREYITKWLTFNKD